ncbi:hypothetical protein [Hymenobacter edaphi]|uniref:Uncharacterized protein n=1 Tax=Hymenobacter edaphi TaxID=2211146 RepID=A0A328B5I2_9BACT|nr:hypothetical protein [Hymenobacter edaphi]RAK62662.1 hypothetical protein DLM85_22605 [Hymenobacter edaphi]
MFDSYETDFGKVNWNWCHSVCIQMHEIEELLGLPKRAELYLKSAHEYEVVGYTGERKFLSVTFILAADRIVIENVNLPSYESIRDVIIRQFLAAAE